MSHRSLFVAFISLTLVAGGAVGAVRTVDDDLVCPGATFTDIQDAVDAAAAGDVIEVCPGTYSAFGVIGKDGLDIHSTGGPLVTFVEGYANGCYGIFIRDIDGLIIDGFDIAPEYPLDSGCDAAAIAAAFGTDERHLTIRNNVVHDIKPAGAGLTSCSGSYGIIGFALNDVQDALVENNTFHDMINEGCIPGTSAEVGAGTANIKFFSNALQVIFVSGATTSPGGLALITIRDNVIEGGRAFNPLAIRVKRAQNFEVIGNQVSGLVNTDGTGLYPSTSLGFSAQGMLVASIMGNVTGNDITADVGFDLEDADQLTITGNDFTGTTVLSGSVRISDDNFICGNLLSAPGVTIVTSPSTGNTFPGGSAFPGNFECPPMGACCVGCLFPPFNCDLRTDADCADHGGDFLGDGTTCLIGTPPAPACPSKPTSAGSPSSGGLKKSTARARRG